MTEVSAKPTGHVRTWPRRGEFQWRGPRTMTRLGSMVVTVAPDEQLQADVLEAQRARFEEDGMLVIKNAVPTDTIDRIREATDRIVAEGRQPGRWIGKAVSAKRRVEYRGRAPLGSELLGRRRDAARPRRPLGPGLPGSAGGS